MLSSHTHVCGPREISHYLGDWPVMSFVFVCTLYNTYYHVFCVCVKNTYYHVFCVYIAQNKPKLQITFVNQSFSHHYQGVNQKYHSKGKDFPIHECHKSHCNTITITIIDHNHPSRDYYLLPI